MLFLAVFITPLSTSLYCRRKKIESHQHIDLELLAFKWVREFLNGYNPKTIIAHIFGLQRLIYPKVWPGKYLLFKSLILGNIANALIFIGFKKGCVFNQSRLGLADWKWPIKSNSAPWPSARTITCFRANFYIALSHHIDTRHWKRLQFEIIIENVCIPIHDWVLGIVWLTTSKKQLISKIPWNT